MISPSRKEWPMDSYLSAWKAFRKISDENVATAQHLVVRPQWPKKEDLVICDLGCGDGKLIQTIFLDSPTKAKEVRLIDPDPDLLMEAKTCLSEMKFIPEPQLIQGLAEEEFPVCAQGTDVILMVHVVYLMRNGAFKKILYSCPPGIPLYVVLDEPDSVFTELWSKTAKKYHRRSLMAHETVQNLPENQFMVKTTTFPSKIRNPLIQEDRPDLKYAILSILCYADVSEDMDPAILLHVKEVIKKHLVEDIVICESTCYEIERLGS